MNELKKDIRMVLWKVVRPLAGTPCQSKDTHDFPDLKEGERCPVCEVYDKADQATQQLLYLFNKLGSEAEERGARNFIKSVTGMLPAFPPKSLDEQAVETLLGKLFKAKLEMMDERTRLQQLVEGK